MQNSRLILTATGYRPVITAWLLALAVAGALAFMAGGIELRRLQRVQAITDCEQQFNELAQILVSYYDSPRTDFEREVLRSHAIEKRVVSRDSAQEAVAETGDEGLFSLGNFRYADRSTTVPAMVLRADVDAAHVDPRFTGWTLRLKFVDDRLQGASAVNPDRARLRRPIAGVGAVLRTLEVVMVIAAGVALVCLAAATPVGPRWRRQVAAVGLAGGALAVVAIALHPARHLRPLLNEPATLMIWGVVLLTLMLLALLPTRQRRANERPRCRCGYDLTGNVSGTCPECGTPTAQGRLDRWADAAAAIADASTKRPFVGACTFVPRLVEAKRVDCDTDLARYKTTLVPIIWTCYRYSMTDACPRPDDDDERLDTVGPAPADDFPQQTTCSFCSASFTAGWVPSDGMLTCPHCGAQTLIDDEPSNADRELEERLEAERRSREVELDSVRVRQVLTERRSLFRMRSYFIALGATAAVAAGQLGIWGFYRFGRNGVDLFVIGYVIAILGLLLGALFCAGKIRMYNRELAKPAQAEPVDEPDFSTLSDGSQRLDLAAQNLARLYERER